MRNKQDFEIRPNQDGPSHTGWFAICTETIRPSPVKTKPDVHLRLSAVSKNLQESEALRSSQKAEGRPRNRKMVGNGGRRSIELMVVLLMCFSPSSLAYRPGDIVPMSKMGQYHSVRTHFTLPRIYKFACNFSGKIFFFSSSV